jgi:hypothetical protein
MNGLITHGCKAACKQAGGGHEGVDPTVARHRRPGAGVDSEQFVLGSAGMALRWVRCDIVG